MYQTHRLPSWMSGKKQVKATHSSLKETGLCCAIMFEMNELFCSLHVHHSAAAAGISKIGGEESGKCASTLPCKRITALFDHHSVCLSVWWCTLRSSLLQGSLICSLAICAALIWPQSTMLSLWRPGLLHYADNYAPAWLTLWVCMCVFMSVSRCTKGKMAVVLIH